MPALPPFAPWIQAPDETKNFATGYQLSAQAAQHAAALAAQQEEARQKTELARQTALIDQQKNEITKQWYQQQNALEKQKQAETERMDQEKIKQTAQESQASLRIQQRLASGEDPDKVYMEEGALANMPGASIAAALRAYESKQAKLPPQFVPGPAEGGGAGGGWTYGNKFYPSPYSPGEKQMPVMLQHMIQSEDAAITKLEAQRAMATSKQIEENIDKMIESHRREKMKWINQSGLMGKKRIVYKEDGSMDFEDADSAPMQAPPAWAQQVTGATQPQEEGMFGGAPAQSPAFLPPGMQPPAPQQQGLQQPMPQPNQMPVNRVRPLPQQFTPDDLADWLSNPSGQ